MNIVTLTYGDYTARINLDRGGNCISLRHRGFGADILREPDYERGLENPYLYGMPILFPVNRISGGCFTFEGRQYRLPVNEPETGSCLHGELHAMPFETEDQTESTVSCVYRSHGAYMGFPHDFSVRLRYVLGNGGLTQVTQITNHSAQNMPLFLGFHTTFNIPFIKGTDPDRVRVEADVAELVERNMQNYLPTGVLLPADSVTDALNRGEFKPFSLKTSRHYRSGERGTVTLYDDRVGVRVCYENDRKLSWRLIYNGNADAYICLEPQNCAVNCPNAPYPQGFVEIPFVAPGETEAFVSKIFCSLHKGERI